MITTIYTHDETPHEIETERTIGASEVHSIVEALESGEDHGHLFEGGRWREVDESRNADKAEMTA